jgi:hypothetical protein
MRKVIKFDEQKILDELANNTPIDDIENLSEHLLEHTSDDDINTTNE